MSLTGSRALDASQYNVISRLQFRIAGPWNGQINSSVTHIGQFGYPENEFGISRKIAGRDVGVYYSTLARKFQVSLSSLSF